MSIMNQKAVLVVAWYGFTKLLNSPVGSWVLCSVAMKDATRMSTSVTAESTKFISGRINKFPRTEELRRPPGLRR